jgi:transcriptional regulator GlxA family with amidase domain
MNSRRGFTLLVAVLSLGLPLTIGAQDERVRVAILVYDGVYNTEFIAPLDVFDHAATHTQGRLQVFTVAPSPGSVTTAEGLRILPQYSFMTGPAPDWLIIPSGENYRTDVDDQALVGWIREFGRRAKVIHSNCWGAFLLGAAGLLDGKQATTYPQSLDEFAQKFPGVTLRRDQLLVDDNDVVTSAGGVVSYDAALYLVEKHFGAEIAARVATGLVIDWEKRRTNYTTAVPASSGP